MDLIRSRTLTAILLGLTCSSLGHAAERDSVARFAWPPGVMASVDVRFRGARSVELGKSISWEMSCGFTMRTRQHGDRIFVTRTNFSGWKGSVPPSLTGAADRIVDAIPTVVVSRDGSFLGVERGEVARDYFLASIEAAGPLNPRERHLLKSATSPSSLTAIAGDHWSVLVALWRGFKVGTNYHVEVRNRTPVPQLGGGEIDIVGEGASTAVARCARGGIERQCAIFKLTTWPDAHQLARILERLLNYQAHNDPKLVAWDQRFEATIVAEVDTLLPHRVTISRRSEIQFELPGSLQRAIGSEDSTKEYMFHYRGDRGPRSR